MAVEKETAVIDIGDDDSEVPEPRRWYRSTLFNAFVIGLVGFIAPGLWNAMVSILHEEVLLSFFVSSLLTDVELVGCWRGPVTLSRQCCERVGIRSNGLSLPLRWSTRQSYRPPLYPLPRCCWISHLLSWSVLQQQIRQCMACARWCNYLWSLVSLTITSLIPPV